MNQPMTRLISTDLAFTPAVKAVQTRKGSRAPTAFQSNISDEIAGFLAEQTTAFLSTASADGQPYVQHRGGAPGFLHVLDEHTIAFADFRGNRQYISLGNLSENPKILFLVMDYAHRQRVKFWGTATVVDKTENAALIAKLTPEGERADQAIVISVTALDVNCPKYISQLIDARVVGEALARRDARIAELESQLALKAR